MDGIFGTLKTLTFAQMVLAWLFVGCYALALGGMLSSRASLRAGLVAVFAGVLFAALSNEWVHGALLVLFAVAGMGLFVALSWALALGSAWLLARGTRQPSTRVSLPSTSPAQAAAQPAGVWQMLRRLRVALVE